MVQEIEASSFAALLPDTLATCELHHSIQFEGVNDPLTHLPIAPYEFLGTSSGAIPFTSTNVADFVTATSTPEHEEVSTSPDFVTYGCSPNATLTNEDVETGASQLPLIQGGTGNLILESFDDLNRVDRANEDSEQIQISDVMEDERRGYFNAVDSIVDGVPINVPESSNTNEAKTTHCVGDNLWATSHDQIASINFNNQYVEPDVNVNDFLLDATAGVQLNSPVSNEMLPLFDSFLDNSGATTHQAHISNLNAYSIPAHQTQYHGTPSRRKSNIVEDLELIGERLQGIDRQSSSVQSSHNVKLIPTTNINIFGDNRDPRIRAKERRQVNQYNNGENLKRQSRDNQQSVNQLPTFEHGPADHISSSIPELPSVVFPENAKKNAGEGILKPLKKRCKKNVAEVQPNPDTAEDKGTKDVQKVRKRKLDTDNTIDDYEGPKPKRLFLQKGMSAPEKRRVRAERNRLSAMRSRERAEGKILEIEKDVFKGRIENEAKKKAVLKFKEYLTELSSYLGIECEAERFKKVRPTLVSISEDVDKVIEECPWTFRPQETSLIPLNYHGKYKSELESTSEQKQS